MFEQYNSEQSYLAPLSLSFLMYKMGIRVVLPHRIVGFKELTYVK